MGLKWSFLKLFKTLAIRALSDIKCSTRIFISDKALLILIYRRRINVVSNANKTIFTSSPIV